MAIAQPLIDTPADRTKLDDAVQRAADAVLARGGAARCNVFTRSALAMFGQVPWRAVPFIPPEIMLLPRWFPFHISKVSYWSRTVMVPLFVIWAHRDIVDRAALWLESAQHADGGWGEHNDSYLDPARGCVDDESTAFQTAWAVLALIAAGHGGSEAARRGADYLIRTQATDGLWHDRWHTAPGFPRVFYLKYHGYTTYFPLWALARYRNLLG